MKEITYPDFIKNTEFTFDFNKPCLIEGCKHKKISDCHPEMKEIESWANWTFSEEFLIYILLMYDKKAYSQGTPLQQKYSDVSRRREMAKIESGISDDQFKTIEEGFPEYTKAITDFLKYQNSRLWGLIVASENSYLEYLDTLMSKQTVFNNDKDLVSTITNKEKVREFLAKVVDDLDRLYLKFYNGDKDLEEIVSKKVKITPESMANMSKK